ncbi:MAG: hypothetical protein JRH18_14425 [Deltaproteobacteria bacterium]|nr:hypothetical protein [Deltaproteobacteria bacterium]MBW1962199.1 hypothetical protein [Deltaproteobacteria bacterium]MBW1992966.1 hypothetical protein [Deltaproteobacteria bacterium]MBW2152852.1 hypothetical protein [Deltaproteobacteria bacterium]
MEVALPVWKNRVSPVFDFAHRVLIASIENRVVTRKRYYRINPDLPSLSQLAKLSTLGVKVLICGAISKELENMVRSLGIHVISSVTGDITQVLDAYLNDTLSSPKFQLPDGRAKGGILHHEDCR